MDLAKLRLANKLRQDIGALSDDDKMKMAEELIYGDNVLGFVGGSKVVEAEIQLNDEQASAFDEIIEWTKNPNDLEYRLGGYAGTGKTTLIKKIIDHNGYSLPTAVSAFTGKAVSVLRRKGISRAQTLHSLMYNVRTENGTTIFERVPAIWQKLVIVDEGSMVSTQLYEDLCSFGVKRLIVGDPAQLEPVGDNPNLMRRCNRTLTQIHRQAENSPIIRLAHEVRNGGRIEEGYWESPDGESSVLVTRDPGEVEFTPLDILICAVNTTRHAWNDRHRFELGWEEQLRPHDTVICLQNVKTLGLYNGMILTVESVDLNEFAEEPFFVCTLVDDLEQRYTNVPVSKEWFGKNYVATEHKDRRKVFAFDYAYAITGHKSQGSEWESVGVYRQAVRQWDMARWDYTAITRASKHLIFCI